MFGDVSFAFPAQTEEVDFDLSNKFENDMPPVVLIHNVGYIRKHARVNFPSKYVPNKRVRPYNRSETRNYIYLILDKYIYLAIKIIILWTWRNFGFVIFEIRVQSYSDQRTVTVSLVKFI